MVARASEIPSAAPGDVPIIGFCAPEVARGRMQSSLARPIPPPFQAVAKLGSLTRGCIRRLIDPGLISIAPQPNTLERV